MGGGHSLRTVSRFGNDLVALILILTSTLLMIQTNRQSQFVRLRGITKDKTMSFVLPLELHKLRKPDS